jgi:cobalt/nickel transport system ATP-binding protein
MKVLMRLLVPQWGEVRLGGRPVGELKSAQLYSRVGMVFQNPADQLFAATVEQDVAFGPRNLGLSEADVAERTREALAAVDAAGLAGRPIHHLSFGEQKRVCLAGVLAMQPAVLVLDEPTAGLDPRGRRMFLRLLGEMPQTMIVSTHDVLMVKELLPRMVILDQGRVAADGPSAELLRDAALLETHGLEFPRALL